MRFLLGVGSHVDEHFVASVEAAFGSGTPMPLAVVESGWRGNSVRVGDVGGQLHEGLERSVGAGKGEYEIVNIFEKLYFTNSFKRVSKNGSIIL